MPNPLIAAVDGPAGSGKSSICRAVASRLGWTYINTGALYRAIGLMAGERSISLDDDANLVKLVQEFQEKFVWDPATGRLYVGADDLTPRLSSLTASSNASLVAKNAALRSALLPVQRKLAFFSPKGAIVDGRDIGTVVFADASCKVFMTASLEERAKRRLRQLESEGSGDLNLQLETLMKEIEERDIQDSKRGTAPLMMSHDAILLDTSKLTVEESVEKLSSIISECYKIKI
jgi:cytidylate kinase